MTWDKIQRLLDLSLITFTLFVWLPYLLAAILLKLIFDGRPLLFKQVRVGMGGRLFTIFKIKTTAPCYKPSPEDWPDDTFPPRTAFGCWLRRHDIDELPQVWNVLKGEMSLVGPRPETPYHSARIKARLPGYGERLLVRPGLTGLAQVRGWRGDTSLERRLAFDLRYISGRGLKLYFVILVRTLELEVRQWSRR